MDYPYSAAKHRFTNVQWSIFHWRSYFYSMKELRIRAERWRVHFNLVRPHSSLGYRSPAPSTRITEDSLGYGKEESKERLPLSHTPGCNKEYLSPVALH